MQLNNVRAEARLLKLDFDDPEIDKHVMIDGLSPVIVDTKDV